MEKNILVMTGSPRINGNTAKLANSFIEGALSAGHKVHKYEAAHERIHGCRACNKCWSTGNPCVQLDEFNELAKHLEAADVIVLASPVYWGSFPAQLKTIIDRTYSYVVPWRQRTLEGKRLILLSCGDSEDISAFAEITRLCEGYASYMKWTIGDHITIPQMVNPDDILKTDALTEAYSLGKNL